MIDEIFIRSIGAIVIAAACFAFAARMLSLPSIIAYLASGLLLGPITGILEVSEAIHLIADTGIILLLFLVGLEISFEKLKGIGSVTLVAGSAQILLTTLLGFLLCLAMGFAQGPALLLGIAMTLSSTVIVVKILVDNQESNHRFGQIAIGILLVQDLFVVILLTLVNGLKGSETLEIPVVAMGLAQAFGGMLLLLAAVMAASKWLLRLPFTWAARSPETLFIWSICWCFLVVITTHVLNLSPEIGAFLAGISLAQLPYQRDMKRRVQPLINFFIAVFFVSLSIDMELAVPLGVWAQALVLALFVVVGKFFIVAMIISRLGFSEKTSFHTALLLTQISEFSFIFIGLAVGAGFVDADAAVLLGLFGLISITVSTMANLKREALYTAMQRSGLSRLFQGKPEVLQDGELQDYHDHVIIVGMNTLGVELYKRLHEKGELVLAIDVDPAKLEDLPGPFILGDASSHEPKNGNGSIG